MSAVASRPVRRVRVAPRPLESRPLVSVVIPCYNYEQFVGAAVASVLDQQGVDVEVIVVDDRSPDGSAAVVRGIAARDDRVQLIQHSVNRGAVDTFNTGLAAVTGDYVVRLDADDLLTPGSLERSVAVAEAHPGVGLVYGHPLHFEGDGARLPSPRLTARRWTVWAGREWLRARCVTGINVITSPEVLMRRSVVDLVGGQRPLAHTHDMEMWLRLAAVSDVAYIEGADQAWHREHAGSLSQALDAGMGDIEDRRDAFHTLFAWSGPYLPETDEFRTLADRALAQEALGRIVHMYDRGKVDSGLADRLRELADGLAAGASATHAGLRRVEARGPAATPMPWQVARAASRRLVNDARYRRWHRRGVFHSDRAR
jgi:GT2 family glycosyltransferase